MPVSVGVMLSTFDTYGDGVPDVASSARAADRLGFDSLWVGDHLYFNIPILDSTVALSTAAAVTTTPMLGFSVMLMALRQPAWAAKQVSSLQHLTGGRVVVGVGVGGEKPEEWEAAGVPITERGRRTDAALSVFAEMASGQAVHLPAPYDAPVGPLLPAGPPPAIWVGGRSEAAFRRTVRFGEAWIGAFADAAFLRKAGAKLAELAAEAERPVPAVTTTVLCHVGDEPDGGLAMATEYVERQYAIPYQRMARFVVRGNVEQVSEQLAGFVDAGVSHIVVMPVGRAPVERYEQLAEVRRRLQAHSA
jgi:alkanesulfonate monooxygenase SsuD/methylene tetrahydromethanopterin reductase-like flavin-dependent oxidoreductase (luciferase family)